MTNTLITLAPYVLHVELGLVLTPPPAAGLLSGGDLVHRREQPKLD